MASPKISVIVPSLNEEKYIHNVFEGLKNQTFKDFEVIVVDGGSKDRTREIARKFGASVIMDKKPPAGEAKHFIGAARNVAVSIAKGDLILFVDADSKPSKNLLEIYYNLFRRHNDIIAATGPLIPLEKTSDFIDYAYWFATVKVVKIAFRHGHAAIFTPNMAIRKSVFKKVGGFDESLVSYEDMDLAKRLMLLGKIKFEDTAIVQTSMRRLVKMGFFSFIYFNTTNVLMYTFFNKPRATYEQVR